MWQALPGWRRRRPRDGTVRSGRARRETLAVKRFELPTAKKVFDNLVPGAEKPADDSAASGPTKLAMIPKADKGDVGATGGNNGQGLVRDPLQFKPGANLPCGSKSDSEAGAGAGFHPVKDFVSGVKKALKGGDKSTGGPAAGGGAREGSRAGVGGASGSSAN